MTLALARRLLVALTILGCSGSNPFPTCHVSFDTPNAHVETTTNCSVSVEARGASSNELIVMMDPNAEQLSVAGDLIFDGPPQIQTYPPSEIISDDFVVEHAAFTTHVCSDATCASPGSVALRVDWAGQSSDGVINYIHGALAVVFAGDGQAIVDF